LALDRKPFGLPQRHRLLPHDTDVRFILKDAPKTAPNQNVVIDK
jgi:hypothetical protein